MTMNSLVFATNNNNKIKEINSLLNNRIKIISLHDINCIEEVPETGATIKENALQKARYVFEKYKYNCFADDTGLEVEALNGMPGVFSARYAGEEKDANKNIEKLLLELKNHPNRKARFVTVIALIIDGNEFLFEGIIKGNITENRFGNSGFGYDPVFMPDGYNLTFAQMSLDQKNKISHRGIATQKMIHFLNEKW